MRMIPIATIELRFPPDLPSGIICAAWMFRRIELRFPPDLPSGIIDGLPG